jgi:vacuolar-type H+-ATPase subunit E/Vma4
MKKGIEDLEKKILNKANEEAELVVSRAKKARLRILKGAKEEAKEIEKEAKKKGEELFEKEKRRMISEKRIDEKREILSVRQRILEQLTLDMEQCLLEMLKRNEMSEWIKSKIEEIVKGKREKVVLVTRKKDKEIYGKIVRKIHNLTLEIEPIGPGFLLRSEENEYDFRFNVISQNVIHRNRKMIVSMLGENNG